MRLIKNCGATLKELWKNGCLEVSTPSGRRSSPPLIKSVMQVDADVMMYVSPDILNDTPSSKKIINAHFVRVSKKTASLKQLDRGLKIIHLTIRLAAFLLMLSGVQSLVEGETTCAIIGFIFAAILFFIKRIIGFMPRIMKTIIKKKR